tara:strand:+ start:10683 stop:10925 length:243 start_codon:yes stop_codon:yes gene_type:complete
VHIGAVTRNLKSAYTDTLLELAVANMSWTTTTVTTEKNVHAKKRSTVLRAAKENKKRTTTNAKTALPEKHPMTIESASLV